jgi:universal stress protein E
MGFRRIAAGVDLGASRRGPTPGSRRALDEARALARRWGSRLTLVHSSRADEHWDPEHGWVFVDGNAPGSGAVLEALAREVGAELRVVHEDPDLALARLAQRGEADLVVVGKRSVPGVDGRRLGSVALKCLRSCPCPVWVVDPDASPGPRRVLAATDLSPVGDRVLEAAAAVAADAELHVLHALQVPLSAQMEDAESTWIAGARWRAEAHVARRLAGTPWAGKVTLHVAPTSPTEAILDAARALVPDLVVLGTISRGGLAGLLVGNTAERVLPHLDGSLLVVKPADFVSPIDA